MFSLGVTLMWVLVTHFTHSPKKDVVCGERLDETRMRKFLICKVLSGLNLNFIFKKT